jgi:hypothetical protein
LLFYVKNEHWINNEEVENGNEAKLFNIKYPPNSLYDQNEWMNKYLF